MAVVGAIAVPHPPLIVPAVGRGQEAVIQDTVDAYRAAARTLWAQGPDCLVVVSPHAPAFRDAFHVTTDASLEGSMAQFRAPQERIRVRCDVELAKEILDRANAAGIFAVGSDRYRADMDHGTFVPLHFLVKAAGEDAGGGAGGGAGEGALGGGGAPLAGEGAPLGGSTGESVGWDLPCPVVRIGLSGLGYEAHRQMGRVVAQAVEALGRRVGFVASGDLSHKLLAEGPYGFAPEGPVFDRQIGEIFASGDLEGLFAFTEEFADAAAECGLRSFQMMAGAVEGLGFSTAMLSNEGPFGVGYGVATCLPPEGTGIGTAALQKEEVDPLVALARLSVETFVATGCAARLPADLPEELLVRRAGAFVSLHSHGQLRGCIGTIAPTTACVAQEVLQNGVSACSQDPRFPAVRPDELDYLEYSVDVLGEAEPVAGPDELDPARYGVIVTKGWRRGLLLPDLEGVDTVAEQVAIAKRKAGIDPADQDVKLSRFQVVRHTAGGAPRKS